MKSEELIKTIELCSCAKMPESSPLLAYAMESFAEQIDGKIQNELLTRIILSHAAIARRLEETVRALSESQTMLIEAQKIAMLGHWARDFKTDTAVWSDSMYAILEKELGEKPSVDMFLSIVHPQDRKHVEEVYKGLYSHTEPWMTRYRLVMPDGRIKWVHLRLQTVYHGGRPVRSYGTLQDVTVMKKAEDELAKYSRHLEELVDEKVKEISDSQIATIFALVKLSESRDGETGAHIERTAGFCRILASKAEPHPIYVGQIDKTFIDTIYKASPLHDIGKVGIADAILLKPGKLSPEEFEIMKSHVYIGYQTLAQIKQRYAGSAFLQMGMDISRYHHEKWDGSGYLAGLAGEAIPLSARIMAIADVYDALRSKRVYKEAYSHEESCGIIVKSKGSHFDPSLVDLFMQANKEFEELYDALM